MSKLVWDADGARVYETGIEQVALYKRTSGSSNYGTGVAWNGVTSLTLTPSGAEPTSLYANDRKYLTMMSAEELGGTIEAYTYPDEWEECDGSAEAATGVFIGQQNRATFGLVAKTLIGNDVDGTKHGYKLHLVYGCLASPSEESHTSVNDSPEAATFSWEFSTTPTKVTGYLDTSYLCIDSTKVDETKLANLEKTLYGDDNTDPTLPTPDEVLAMLKPASGT